MTPQNSRKADWVWLTCVAALVAAVAWTGTSLTATGRDLQTSAGNQTRAAQTSSAQPQAGRAGETGGDRRQMSPPTPLSSFKWWNDAEVKKELGLGEDKAKRLDDYFQTRSRLMQPVVDDWAREREKLEKMTQERVVDDSSYGIQVWRYEALNAKLRETRQVMLYRMSKELSSDQYKKLRELLDRRFNSGRGGRGGPSSR